MTLNLYAGFFSCQCSKHSGSWQIFEKFLKIRNNEPTAKSILNDPRFKSDIFDYKPIQLVTKLISKLSNELCDTILSKFNFQVSNGLYNIELINSINV